MSEDEVLMVTAAILLSGARLDHVVPARATEIAVSTARFLLAEVERTRPPPSAPSAPPAPPDPP